eukprot:GGOE01011359.1.p1 GENE.GGOE01011359.1~~GGOE01011359.1.p1  ORF type:complete len:1039 (+),score=293.62 GGOE01011359.1:27-3119(+)
MADAKKAEPLDIVLLIDITGSMGSQIDAVKSMCRTFAASLGASILSLQLHIITFTENTVGCYTSHYTSVDPFELVQYINDLTLGRPPEHPNVSANGGDGPENTLAGLVTMLDRVGTVRDTICFLITDAPPHFKATHSEEAKLERRWLVEHGILTDASECDVYNILHTVVDAYQGRLIICPIVYEAQCTHWFAQAARITGGLLLKSCTTNSQSLANTLIEIVEALHLSRVAGRPQFQGQLQGFQALDLSAVLEFMQEEQLVGPQVQMPAVQDIQAAMFGLLESVLTIGGRKFTKRSKEIGPTFVMSCVQLLVLLVQRLAGPPAEEEAVKDLLEKVLDGLEPADRKYLNAAIEHLPTAPIPTMEDSEGLPQCIISLDTAMEAIGHMPPTGERQVSKWMEVVMRLLFTRLVDIKFPEKNGEADLADSWSCNVIGVGPSMLTAYSAMLLRSGGTYRDPQAGGEYKAAVVFAHPGDTFASAVLTLVSATPLLDQLSTYLVCGKPLCFRNLWAGTASAVILFHIRQCGNNARDLMGAEWDHIRCWLHSLRCHARPVGLSVLEALREDQLNPADAVGKLLGTFAWLTAVSPPNERLKALRELVCSRTLQYLVEELVTDDLAWHVKWFSDRFDLGLFLPAECLLARALDFDPLRELHPLEGAEGPILCTDWQQQAIHKLQSHPRFQPLQRQVQLLLALLQANPSSPTPPPSTLEGLPTSFDAIFLESALVERRTGRYELVEEKHRRSVPSLPTLAERYVRKQLVKELGALKLKRTRHAEALLVQRALALKGSREACCEQLAALREVILGTEYRLQRTHVPSMVMAMVDQEQLKTLGAALLLDRWTSLPPSALRRHLPLLRNHFESNSALQEEITAALNAAAICMRMAGTNRHGHCSTNPFPGSDGWTPEYAEKRKDSGKRRVEDKLADMEAFTAFAEEARRWAESTPFRCFIQQQLATKTPKCLPVLRSLFAVVQDLQEVRLKGAASTTTQQVVAVLEDSTSFWSLRHRTLPKVSTILDSPPLVVAWASPKATAEAKA